MILGYEQPVEIPVMSIYDKDMMKMYLGALLKDYELGVADQKAFIEKYGDFISPIEGASEAYYNEGVGKVMNIYNLLEAQGVDPIRSVLGRAMLSKAMNSVDRAKMATIRESAKNREAYNEAVNKAKAAGKYDPEVERQAMIQAGINPDQPWDNNKLWTRTSPEYYTSFNDTWSPIMKAVPKTSKTTVDPKTGIKYNQEGVFEETLDPVIELNYNAWAATPSGQVYLARQKEKLRQANPLATDEQLDKMNQNAAKATAMALGLSTSNPEADKGSLDVYNQKQENARAAADRAVSWYNATHNGSGSNQTTNYDLFAEARSNSDSFVGYVPYDSYHQKIDPMSSGIKLIRGDSKIQTNYMMNQEDASSTIYTHESVYGNGSPKNVHFINRPNRSYRFVPMGAIHSKKVNGKYRYFISGKMQYVEGKQSGQYGTGIYEMEVKERGSRYGTKANR